MEWDLSQYEINNDGNSTFVIGDPMKKVHMGNKSHLLIMLAPTKWSLSMVCDYGARMHNLRG